MSTSDEFPTVAETQAHPAYPTVIWALEPHTKGLAEAAIGRGGPVKLAWEVHGEGPVKVMFIMGLVGIKAAWQRQTLHFGHDNAERFSVLLVDNRGAGESDKPLSYRGYSTSQMAADLLDVLAAVGWEAERSVHAVGISLGGMVLQELACLAPERFASLNLLSTASSVENHKGWVETIADRAALIVPKGMEESIRETGQNVFPLAWLRAPDGSPLPTSATPRCAPAPTPDGAYLKFGSNFQRFQAQELVKRSDPAQFSLAGFFMQLIAAGWHKKTEAQLRDMADRVGRERIAVLHSEDDGMVSVEQGRKLIKWIEPGVGDIVDGLGHGPMLSKPEWLNEWLTLRFANGEKLAGRA